MRVSECVCVCIYAVCICVCVCVRSLASREISCSCLFFPTHLQCLVGGRKRFFEGECDQKRVRRGKDSHTDAETAERKSVSG